MFAAGHAAAVDGDGDGIDDGLELTTQRSVEYKEYRETPSAYPLVMQLKSYSIDTPTNDRFEVQYRPGEFEVEYVRNSEAGLVGISYRMQIHSIVEWTDTNRDGSISWDEIIGRAELGSSAFGAVPIDHEQNESADGGTVHTTRIRSNGNELLLTLTIASRFYRISADRILTPMEIQLDAEITRPLSDYSSRVGVEIWIDTEDQVEFEEDSWSTRNGFSRGESALNVSVSDEGREAAIFYAWAGSASVNNRSGHVSHEGPDTQAESEVHAILLGYPVGGGFLSASVKHTSSLGVVSAAYESALHPPPRPLDADPVLFGVSLGAAAAIVAASMAVARRRRLK